jgi:hypothetical protein
MAFDGLESCLENPDYWIPVYCVVTSRGVRASPFVCRRSNGAVEAEEEEDGEEEEEEFIQNRTRAGRRRSLLPSVTEQLGFWCLVSPTQTKHTHTCGEAHEGALLTEELALS